MPLPAGGLEPTESSAKQSLDSRSVRQSVSFIPLNLSIKAMVNDFWGPEWMKLVPGKTKLINGEQLVDSAGHQ